jgi:hypothetical protein
MRCKRVAKKGEVPSTGGGGGLGSTGGGGGLGSTGGGGGLGSTKPVTQAPLKGTASANEKGFVAKATETVTKQVKENGIIPFIEAAVFIIGLVLAFYYARSETNITYGEKPSLWAQSAASYVRGLFVKKPIELTTPAQ